MRAYIARLPLVKVAVRTSRIEPSAVTASDLPGLT